MGRSGEFFCNFAGNNPIELFYERMMRFLGNIEAKADSKGRVFFPAAFRKILQRAGEDCLVMRRDVFQSCLTLYPESVWNEQMDLLRSRLSRWDAREQQIFRQFVSDVELLSLDASGRLLIPKRYLKMADIAQEVRFIGLGDTIEIWSGIKVERPFVKPAEFSDALQGLMRIEGRGGKTED